MLPARSVNPGFMILSLICAMAENHVIGSNNCLPWHLPGDLQHFRATTMGHSIIMGRNTWESIGRPLPGRYSIVITTDREYAAEGARVVHSIDEALNVAQKARNAPSIRSSIQKNVIPCSHSNADEIFVIGGGALYAAVMPLAHCFHLTRVHARVDGDTFLTGFNESEWKEKSRQLYHCDESNPYDYSICLLERKMQVRSSEPNPVTSA